MPAPEPGDAEAMIREVAALRTKLLRWAAPLVDEKVFDAAAVERIRAGSGNKDVPSDVVALVALYRAHWDKVENMTAVTEQDLLRGGDIGPKVFVLVSRRENPELATPADASLRVRRAWTLMDRAYDQCRRAIQFLRYEEGDADEIAPSLRRNAGRSRETSGKNTGPVATLPVSPEPSPLPAAAAAAAGAPLPAAVANGPAIGNGGSPFVR